MIAQNIRDGDVTFVQALQAKLAHDRDHIESFDTFWRETLRPGLGLGSKGDQRLAATWKQYSEDRWNESALACTHNLPLSLKRAVSPHIPIDRDAVTAFCRRHHIRRLALFGSVLRDDFRADSDVDVLVEFQPGHVPGLDFVTIEREFCDNHPDI